MSWPLMTMKDTSTLDTTSSADLQINHKLNFSIYTPGHLCCINAHEHAFDIIIMLYPAAVYPNDKRSLWKSGFSTYMFKRVRGRVRYVYNYMLAHKRVQTELIHTSKETEKEENPSEMTQTAG